MADQMKIITMGVSGCGKSTLGAALAAALGVAFEDGDALHSPASIAKMAAGRPLDDTDRAPWLAAIGVALAQPGGRVLACSALKRAYRDLIRAHEPAVIFVHVHGSSDILAARMGARPGHFMPAALLDSQLAALEPLGVDERGIVIDITLSPAAQCAQAVAQLDALRA